MIPVTAEDVERVTRREFPESASEVLDLLDGYQDPDSADGTNRVRLGALKLAAGDRDKLARLIASAKRDYRNIIAYAESPGYMRDVSPASSLSPAERNRIVEADLAQYRAWLQR